MASRNGKRDKKRNRALKSPRKRTEGLNQIGVTPNRKLKNKNVYQGPKLKDYNLTEDVLKQASLNKPIAQIFYAVVGGILGLIIGSIVHYIVIDNTSTQAVENIFAYFVLVGGTLGVFIGFLCGKFNLPNTQAKNAQKYLADLEIYRSERRQKWERKENQVKGLKSSAKSQNLPIHDPYKKHVSANKSTLRKHKKKISGNKKKASVPYERLSGNELISKITWKEAEDLIAGIFKLKEWNVTTTGNGTDSGVDVRGNKNGQVLRCQVKKWDNKVSRPIVQQLVGQAYADKATLAVVVALGGGFTEAALKFKLPKEGIDLQLWGNKEVASVIDQMGPKKYAKLIRQVKPELLKVGSTLR